MNLTLNIDGVDAKLTLNNNGILEEKYIDLNEFLTKLSFSQKINTGILPSGCKYFSGNQTDYVLIIETPKKIRNIKFAHYDDDDSKSIITDDVLFPKCLFGFKVNAKRLQKSLVYCVKNPIYKDDDSLYMFPFGNVYEDGSICWGKNDNLKVENPLQLTSLVDLFFSSPFNNDLFDLNMAGINKVQELVCFIKESCTLNNINQILRKTRSLNFKHFIERKLS